MCGRLQRLALLPPAPEKPQGYHHPQLVAAQRRFCRTVALKKLFSGPFSGMNGWRIAGSPTMPRPPLPACLPVWGLASCRKNRGEKRTRLFIDLGPWKNDCHVGMNGEQSSHQKLILKIFIKMWSAINDLPIPFLGSFPPSILDFLFASVATD